MEELFIETLEVLNYPYFNLKLRKPLLGKT